MPEGEDGGVELLREGQGHILRFTVVSKGPLDIQTPQRSWNTCLVFRTKGLNWRIGITTRNVVEIAMISFMTRCKGADAIKGLWKRGKSE